MVRQLSQLKMAFCLSVSAVWLGRVFAQYLVGRVVGNNMFRESTERTSLFLLVCGGSDRLLTATFQQQTRSAL